MNWEVLSQLAQILEGVAVLAAIVFGIVQLRQYKQQRKDAAAVELMRSLQDVSFVEGMRLVFTLPNDISLEEVSKKGIEYENAVFVLCTRFELIGLIVYRKSIPLELVDELLGGATVDLWRKLRTWTAAYRLEQDNPYFWEWFQWLAMRLEERAASNIPPAYEKIVKA